MSRLVKKYNNSIDAVDCLERIMTCVNDWNGQNIDFTIEEYENILNMFARTKDNQEFVQLVKRTKIL